MSSPHTRDSPKWQQLSAPTPTERHSAAFVHGFTRPQTRVPLSFAQRAALWLYYNMRQLLTLGLLLCAMPAFAEQATSECACINRNGAEVPLGQIACLTVGGKSFMARCSFSQNVLTWRRVQDGCIVAQNPYPFSPAPHLAEASRADQSHL